MTARHEGENSIQSSFAVRDLKRSSGFESKGAQTGDECEIEIRIPIVVRNVQKHAVARNAPHFCHFFSGGTVASSLALATRNVTTLFAGTLIAPLPASLSVVRALRSSRTIRPTPGSTNSPVSIECLASKDS